jgi:hypothetical protein
MVVELTNGCSLVFPPRALQGMARASGAELADVEILGQGHALHWPHLDADFTVPGTRAWMASELARRAGQSKSPAKAAAARANGRKGGDPDARRREIAGVAGTSLATRRLNRPSAVSAPHRSRRRHQKSAHM